LRSVHPVGQWGAALDDDGAGEAADGEGGGGDGEARDEQRDRRRGDTPHVVRRHDDLVNANSFAALAAQDADHLAHCDWWQWCDVG
jgi:hypothetical protein